MHSVAENEEKTQLTKYHYFNPQAAIDEMRYHAHPSKRRKGPPYVSWCFRGIHDNRIFQKSFPITDLPDVIREIGNRPHWQHEHHYITQNEFSAPNRRAVNLWSMGCVWADLDLNSADYNRATAEWWAYRLIDDCKDFGIPCPSMIVWSGRGIHAKWIFDSPLTAQALPRWTSVMREIHRKLLAAGWPVDQNARDVSRVLRIAGTCNPKPGIAGRIETREVFAVFRGVEYDFDVLADEVLPYTREEVRTLREDRQALRDAQRIWSEWDANRRKAEERLGKTVRSATEMATVEAAQGLWWRRLDAIKRIAAARGGIGVGHRNDWLWVSANALAWGLGDAGKLWYELPVLARQIAPTFTQAEAFNSASSVYQRLKKHGRDGLYKMRTETLIERLGLTDAEARLFKGSGHTARNPGALDLPPLEGLSYDDWVKEVRRRQSLGATYTHEQRRLANEDRRAKARTLRDQGLSLRAIAKELGLPYATVRHWLVKGG